MEQANHGIKNTFRVSGTGELQHTDACNILGHVGQNSRITQASGRFVFEQSTLTILWQDPATLPSAGDGS